MGNVVNEISVPKDLTRNIICDFVKYDTLPIHQKKTLKVFLDKYKNRLYTLLLYKLTSIYFEPVQAKQIWFDVVKHRNELVIKLKREIDIEVSILDYFLYFRQDLIDNPLIIEEKMFEGIKQRILIDELTGLFNYRYFKQRIKEETAKSKRYNLPFSIIMLDIDDFKGYNDTYGHIEGNKVLIKIAKALKDALRISDTIIRFGGEEFVVILPHTTKKEALLTGEKIRTKIALLKNKRKVTMSGGVATFLVDTKTNENNLVKFVDSALYMAKYEGKNRICNYLRERRIFKRIPISKENNLKIKLINNTISLKKIKNLSRGGISVFLDKKIQAGTIIEGKLKNPNKDLKFLGQIVWSNKEDEDLYETGIKFLDIPDKKLKEYFK